VIAETPVFVFVPGFIAIPVLVIALVHHMAKEKAETEARQARYARELASARAERERQAEEAKAAHEALLDEEAKRQQRREELMAEMKADRERRQALIDDATAKALLREHNSGLHETRLRRQCPACEKVPANLLREHNSGSHEARLQRHCPACEPEIKAREAEWDAAQASSPSNSTSKTSGSLAERLAERLEKERLLVRAEPIKIEDKLLREHNSGLHWIRLRRRCPACEPEINAREAERDAAQASAPSNSTSMESVFDFFLESSFQEERLLTPIGFADSCLVCGSETLPDSIETDEGQPKGLYNCKIQHQLEERAEWWTYWTPSGVDRRMVIFQPDMVGGEGSNTWIVLDVGKRWGDELKDVVPELRPLPTRSNS
jgi:hypothetical protein